MVESRQVDVVGTSWVDPKAVDHAVMKRMVWDLSPYLSGTYFTLDAVMEVML